MAGRWRVGSPRTSAVLLLASALVGAGCAVTLPQAGVVETADGTEVAPRLIWIPEWRLYLREGLDAVHYRGAYYSFLEGQWHVAASPGGPWAPVERPAHGGAASRDTRPERPRDIAAAGPGAGQAPNPVRPPHEGDGADSARGLRIARLAMKYRGVPYVWGGSSPSGFDCSGFVQHVYAEAGIAIPRTVAMQYRWGTPVSRDDLEPGDLVFFNRLRHNGIYIGDGRFVHASSAGDRVRISSLDNSWFERRWVGARRPAGAPAREAQAPAGR